AEQAAQALRAMAKGDFDTPRTHATLYSEAFWHLACLRRAGELSPRETWPDNALEQRNLLADAAGRLLVCVGGTPEAKASLKLEDAERALEDFTRATNQLREIANRESASQPPPIGEGAGAPREQVQRRTESTKPGYPKPPVGRVNFASKQLAEV